MIRLEYKGFLGSFNWVVDENSFHGKIDDITDLVTFGGYDMNELVTSFKMAVEDYIELKKQPYQVENTKCKFYIMNNGKRVSRQLTKPEAEDFCDKLNKILR